MTTEEYIIKQQKQYAIAETTIIECPHCGNTGFIFLENTNTVTRCECNILQNKISIYNNANIPAHFYKAHLATMQQEQKKEKIKEIYTEVKETLEQTSFPKGILLMGGVGCGKTHLLCAIIREYIFTYGKNVQYINFGHLLSQIKEGYEKHISESAILKPIYDVDILAIDDLGKGKNTDWENSILDSIISSRYDSDKIMIFTTNYTENKKTTFKERKVNADGTLSDVKVTLAEKMMARVYSRLKEMCVFIDMSDIEDYRKIFSLEKL